MTRLMQLAPDSFDSCRPEEMARLAVTGIQELRRRRKARTNLLDFTGYTFPAYHINWHHRVLCSYLDRFVSGDLDRLIISLPPRHGKTEHASLRLPAYILGRNPDAQIIATTHTASGAARVNRKLQRIIDSPAYQRLFPGTQLFGQNVRTVSRSGTWLKNSETFEVVGRGGVYESRGVGQAIAGYGADYLIMDDVFRKIQTAYSPTERQTIDDWYLGDVFPRLEQGGRILMTMTRYHRDDLIGRRLLEDEAGRWTVVNFEAVRTDEPNVDDPRQPDEALWPWKKTRKDLEEIRNQDLTKWAALYQGRPRPEGSQEWPDAYFGPHVWFDEWPSERLIMSRVVALDASKGRGDKTGDYSAFIKLAWVAGDLLYVDCDMANDRNPSSIVEVGCEIQRQFQPQYFGVAKDSFEELFELLFEKRAKELGMHMPTYTVHTNGVPKPVRIRRLTEWLSRGKLRFKANSHGARLLVEQLRDFPNAEHDDGPDALEMATRLLTAMAHEHWDDGLGDRLNVLE